MKKAPIKPPRQKTQRKLDLPAVPKERVRQFCHSKGAGEFKDAMKEKYRLLSYTDIHKPVFFMGCYDETTLDQIVAHKNIILLMWCGTDILRCLFTKSPGKNKRRREALRSNWIKHIAISDFIADDLRKCGLKYKRINLTPFTHRRNPKPLGKAVFLYYGVSRKKFYNYALFKQVEKECKGIEFISAYSNQYRREEMFAIYEKCFINLRLTPHDGLSNTVIEMGMMGRRSVWNNGFPGVYKWKSKKRIVSAIKTEQQRIGRTDNILPGQVHKYLNVGKNWLNLEYWYHG